MAKILSVKVDKGSGDPLVLLPGLGNNYKSWTYVLRNLDYKKHRVVSMDLLGFGDSPKPKDIKYTPKDHAKAVISTLDKLKIKDATIAGHSMGCNVAIEVAKERPDLASKLVLLGAPLYKTTPRGGFWARLLKREGVYFQIFSIVKKNPDLTVEGAKKLDKLVPLIKGMEITEETWPAYKASLSGTIMQTRSFKDACKLKVPILMVYGKLDVFVIKRNLKKVARRNKEYVKFKTVLGPHEITPLQGKTVAEMIESF